MNGALGGEYFYGQVESVYDRVTFATHVINLA